MSLCPICDKELEVKGAMHEDGTESCPDGHYEFTHSYGAFTEHFDIEGHGFNSLTLAWGYNDKDHTMRNSVREVFMAYARLKE